MSWLAVVLALVWVLDGLRLRARLRRLPTVPPSNQPVAQTHVFLLAPNVSLPDAVQRSASAWAEAEGLEALDLIPADLPVEPLIGLLQAFDPAKYRGRPFARGRTAGHAMLVHTDLIGRAGLPTAEAGGAADFAEMAIRIKEYAPRGTAHAIVEGFSAQPMDGRELRPLLETLLPKSVNAFLTGQLVLLIFMIFLAVWTWWGLLALAVFHFQPLIVLANQGVKPRDLGWAVALRWPLAVRSWFQAVTGPRRLREPDDAKRAEYERLLAAGLERFFESPRDDCPHCGGTELTVEVETPDLLQYKPGRFVLQRCGGCGHLFQNPRLSLQGLEFYYRDFYEGCGERSMESVFGASIRSYLARAEMLQGSARPHRWLDVGGGHGHFALAAKQVWPETEFDGLDQSESIVKAEQKGWVEHGYRGSFLTLAPKLCGYDVLSMSHYLEHTREPWEEIGAAADVLPDGAHLIIEVPDPESMMRKVLRRYWLPYFQPQHQHLIPAANLDDLLRRHGFEPVLWHRGSAHQPVDLVFAAWMLLNSVAGPPERPWRRKLSIFDRIRRIVVWTGFFWLIPLGWGCDHVLAVVLRREWWSNTYRVLARRTPRKSVTMRPSPPEPA